MKTRDETQLVVFWTLFNGEKDRASYRKRRKATAFPVDADPAAAATEILDTNGRITDYKPDQCAPMSYAEISRVAIIHPHEIGEIETWTAEEVTLFSEELMEECRSPKPLAY